MATTDQMSIRKRSAPRIPAVAFNAEWLAILSIIPRWSMFDMFDIHIILRATKMIMLLLHDPSTSNTAKHSNPIVQKCRSLEECTSIANFIFLHITGHCFRILYYRIIAPREPLLLRRCPLVVPMDGKRLHWEPLGIHDSSYQWVLSSRWHRGFGLPRQDKDTLDLSVTSRRKKSWRCTYLFISIRWIILRSWRMTWDSASRICSPFALRSACSHEYSSDISTITSI